MNGLDKFAMLNIDLVGSENLSAGHLHLGKTLIFVTFGLGDLLVGLITEDKFEVTRGAHVGVDTTMSTVSPSATRGSTLGLDVRDNKILGIKSGKLSVGFSVLQQRKKDLTGFFGPST